MNIFLTGANGYVGGTVARRLIAAGHSVRGLVRDRQKGDDLRALQIEPVIGSLDHHELLLAEARQAAVEKAPAGAFYFIENGEASFGEIGAALAERMKLGAVQSWSVAEATPHWGEMHSRYTFGSNSRVRAKRARAELGWTPRHTSAIDWIKEEMPL